MTQKDRATKLDLANGRDWLQAAESAYSKGDIDQARAAAMIGSGYVALAHAERAARSSATLDAAAERVRRAADEARPHDDDLFLRVEDALSWIDDPKGATPEQHPGGRGPAVPARHAARLHRLPERGRRIPRVPLRDRARHHHRSGGIVTTPPRPPLDETLARIGAVLGEPERLADGQQDHVGQALATAGTEPDEEPTYVAYLFGRAIGWFRR